MMRISSKQIKDFYKVLVWCFLVIGTILFCLPLAWMISTSLKPLSQIWIFPPKWIPKPVLWGNYIAALKTFPFHLFFANTGIITLFSLIGLIISSSLCAYGFARLRFPGRDFLFMIVLSVMMLPFIVILIPRYILFRYLGWIDTFKPLIVPNYFGVGGYGVFSIFLLRQFFRQIPLNLSDSARIDGCSEFGIYARIIMPLSKPGLIAITIFAFLYNWNNFLEPLIYINTPEKFTVSLGLTCFTDLYFTNWSYLMAGSVVAIVPVLIMFFYLQRYFIRGIILTGLKT